MAGTVTATETKGLHGIRRVLFTWVSDASGNADGATTGTYSGEIVRAVHIPDTAGTAPTDLYDVVLNDDDGADVLHGTGANVPIASLSTNKAREKDGLGAVHNSLLTLHVTNAGNAKGGKVVVYLK